MASENKTVNYGLNQWQGNEYAKRQDFVDDNLKTDTAIKAVDNSLVAHKAENASKHITESGSNANGKYIKFDNGTMICYKESINLLMVDSGVCQENWSFPATFIDANYSIAVSFRSITSTTITIFMLNLPYAITKTLTLATLRQLRIQGQPNFTSGDSVTVDAIAVGRWK